MTTKDWSKKTSDMPVGVRRQWRADRALRHRDAFPGRPVPSRAVQRQFWRSDRDPGIHHAGRPSGGGVRTGEERGGFPSCWWNETVSFGRALGIGILSVAERGEIAILWEKQTGVREIARRIGRNPATISRELRRNAATRGGKQIYRAGRWPSGKLRKPLSVPNKQNSWVIRACKTMFRGSVLLGLIRDENGVVMAGPDTPAWKGRSKPHRADRRWLTAWSPEQISQRLRIDFPDDESMRISHEAILNCSP